MKYAVVKVVNGNFAIVTEGWTDVNKARVSYYGTCQALYNDIANVQTMAIMIIDSLGNILERDFYDASLYLSAQPIEQPANEE